jgi:hypothetical protein
MILESMLAVGSADIPHNATDHYRMLDCLTSLAGLAGGTAARSCQQDAHI